MNRPLRHSRETEALARLLQPRDVYDWLVTVGYFPESYILPPCFCVAKHPSYGKYFSPRRGGKLKPTPSQVCDVHFPKTELTDRTFAILHPELHSDIATEIATHWEAILDVLFDPQKRVYTYSFPIPLSSATPGQVGSLRAGRLIYEWIEMVENDLAEEAYAYKYLVLTDVKNFYPSVYTHSIAWAMHTRSVIRAPGNRHKESFLGNRLDKLFQYANDECTNGLPIGPAVSDLIAELILCAVDSRLSACLQKMGVLAVRFKDDYRFLCKTREDCATVTKHLQKGLKEFNLLLNEDKTQIASLPEGIFREWVSRYHIIRPSKRRRLTFREFRELYLGVLRIDQDVPGTGIVDRFIADVIDCSYRPRFPVSSADVDKTISLLLLLADRRIKAFPRILGLVEAIMTASGRRRTVETVERYLNKMLLGLLQDAEENRYLISWILYFLKSNGLSVKGTYLGDDPVLRSLESNRSHLFPDAKDFRLFRGLRATRHRGSLLRHTDVFKTQ